MTAERAGDLGGGARWGGGWWWAGGGVSFGGGVLGQARSTRTHGCAGRNLC